MVLSNENGGVGGWGTSNIHKRFATVSEAKQPPPTCGDLDIGVLKYSGWMKDMLRRKKH